MRGMQTGKGGSQPLLLRPSTSTLSSIERELSLVYCTHDISKLSCDIECLAIGKRVTLIEKNKKQRSLEWKSEKFIQDV